MGYECVRWVLQPVVRLWLPIRNVTITTTTGDEEQGMEEEEPGNKFFSIIYSTLTRGASGSKHISRSIIGSILVSPRMDCREVSRTSGWWLRVRGKKRGRPGILECQK